MDYQNKYKQAYLKIKHASRILVVGHLNPDGDALSSVCAFLELAALLKISADAYCHDKRISAFNYLPHESKILDNKEEILPLTKYDVIVIVDCGAKSRTFLANEIDEVASSIDRPFIIEFDHHPPVDDFSDLEIRQPDKASTTEVVYNFLESNQIPFNKNLANCILTGLLTDTGNFLYSSANSTNIKIASKMLSYGASLPKIINNTLRNQSLLTMKLWGTALNNLQFSENHGLAYSVITKQEIDSILNTSSEEEVSRYLSYDLYGDIAGFLSTVSDAEAIMLLREEKEGKIKGSLRTSKANVDVSVLAKKFGGGGHTKASGFMIEGRLVKTENGWEIV